MPKHDPEIQKIAESLSEIERKILPHLEEKDMKKIEKKADLDPISIVRALTFLHNKGLVNLKTERTKIVDIGVNGVLYKKKGLPERRLLTLLETKGYSLEEAQKLSNLTENEFKAAIGVLKNKAMINLKEGKITLNAKKEELSKRMLEEKILDILPKNFQDLQPEELYAVKQLEKRKNIIEIKEEQKLDFSITELGIEVSKISLSEVMIEQITPEIIRDESWRGKKFRRYDILSNVPKVYGGKRHFVNQAIDHAREIWTELGFKEMQGNLIATSFWNFDALFTAQDHPVREMQDTFFIKDLIGKLPEKKLVENVKNSHEGKVKGSKGWGYKWSEDEAKKIILRTHTTVLSSKTLAKLKSEDYPAKFFAIGKCYRNEAVDYGHLFEFNQTEGIVVDENANFKHLLGYLKEFAKKMGYEKVRFRPAYFPYTEPSVEGDVWDSKRKKWKEVLAAGIFRPEVTEPLLGRSVPVLAWGPGFDRIIMEYYNINDIRELYKNNISQLRKMKYWI